MEAKGACIALVQQGSAIATIPDARLLLDTVRAPL